MKGSSLLEKIAEFRQEMTNIELEINHFKNKKTHFKEDFSETTYENMKKKLEDATKKYQTMVARFNTNYMLNEKEQQELFELQISYDDLLQRANAIFAEYMKTKNISILGDLVAFQENEIKPIEDKMDEKKCAKRVMKIGSVEDQLITHTVPEAHYDFLESGTFAVKHFHI
jgi:DNA repair exonuclease SbcCD ATPase subunit